MTESSDANFVSSYFDCTHLETLRILSMSGAPFDVGEVVDLFLSSSASDLVELKSSLAAGDREQIRQTTHRLKGACSQIGAIRMTVVCEELEAAISSQSSSDLDAKIDELAAEFDCVSRLLGSSFFQSTLTKGASGVRR